METCAPGTPHPLRPIAGLANNTHNSKHPQHGCMALRQPQPHHHAKATCIRQVVSTPAHTSTVLLAPSYAALYKQAPARQAVSQAFMLVHKSGQECQGSCCPCSC